MRPAVDKQNNRTPHQDHWIWLAIGWLSPLLAWALVAWIHTITEPPEKWAVDELYWVEQQQPLSLPLSLETSGIAAVNHLTTTVSLQRGQLHALLIPRVEQNLRAKISGTVIGDGGLPLSTYRNRHRPLWFTFPVAEQGEPSATLELALVSTAAQLELPQVFFGPAAALESAWQWRDAYKRHGMLLLTAALWVMVALLLVFAHVWRTPVYIWGALGFAFWGVHNLNFLLVSQPFGPVGWQLFIHIALAGFVWAMTLFAHRLLGQLHPARERVIGISYLVACGVMVVLALGGGLVVADSINLALRPILTLNSLYLCWMYVAAAWHSQRAHMVWLAGANLTGFSFGIHDSLVEVGALPVGSVLLTQYSVGLGLMAFVAVLLAKLTDDQRLAHYIEQRRHREISQARLALSAEAEGRVALERSATLHRERERIMRDVHDGIGGQLVSLLAAVRQGGAEPAVIEQAVDRALKDLRLIIDSMDEAAEDLAVALGMFRSRSESMLSAAGLQSQWETADLPDGVNLGPERLLQVYRILQESLQNVLKHSRASQVTIKAQVLESDQQRVVEISIRDNGVGLDDDAEHGHGLSNMRDRASRVGGSLRIRRADPGSEVLLRVPWRRPRN